MLHRGGESAANFTRGSSLLNWAGRTVFVNRMTLGKRESLQEETWVLNGAHRSGVFL